MLTTGKIKKKKKSFKTCKLSLKINLINYYNVVLISFQHQRKLSHPSIGLVVYNENVTGITLNPLSQIQTLGRTIPMMS